MFGNLVLVDDSIPDAMLHDSTSIVDHLIVLGAWYGVTALQAAKATIFKRKIKYAATEANGLQFFAPIACQSYWMA